VIKQVRKRGTSTVQPFSLAKISAAISAAWKEAKGKTPEPADLSEVVGEVFEAIRGEDTSDVEKIQDLIEVSLMRHGQHDVAKAYILYRKNRAEKRKKRLKPNVSAMSEYIHASKYARYVPELQRREVYDETIARVELMHMKKFPALREEIGQAFDLVRARRVLPSMRTLQFGGAAVEANNNRGYNCSATLVDRPRVFAETMFLLLSGCGVGYSIQLDHVDKLPPLAYVDASKVVHHVVEDTIEGWSNAVDALVRSYIDGTNVEFAFHQIRPAGSPLKTSGGRAPGHQKLKLTLQRVRDVLHGAQGRQLRPVECHRMMCHIADAVLSGGIRRSAMIALFSFEDSEMMNIKVDANWFPREPWLANANNSCVLVRGEATEKQFKRIIKSTRAYGEPGFFFASSPDHVTNPCQPGWATVLTPEGIRTFDDISIGSTIWSGKQWTTVTNKVMTGIKPVSGYHTRAGVFYGTSQHRVISGGERVEAGDAETIDISVGGAEGLPGLDPQVIMDGLVLGDGTVHKASNHAVWLCIGEDDHDYPRSEVSSLILRSRKAAQATAWEISTNITSSELPLTYLRSIPDRYRFGDERVVRGFLRGLYSANGSVVGDARVTLKASSLNVILHAQEMLSSLGIPSYYTTNRSTAITFGNGEYTCRQSYDLNITSARGEFARLIGFIQKGKTERLLSACSRSTLKARKKLSYEVVDVQDLGAHPVYDITVAAEEHTYWTGGMLVSNCAEIGLDPVLVHPNGRRETGWAMCNLCEINAAKLTSLEDFKQVARAATLIGTLQAAYTDMPYLGSVTEAIVRRDALLGIGMTGMQDAPHIARNPEYQRIIADDCVEWNSCYAGLIGINPAARVTCVKPSGTTTLALGNCGSGIHAHHARRYIRRVTADALEVVFQEFKKSNPHMCVQKPDGKWVIEFPVEAPEGALLKEDFGAIDFLEMVRSTQQNWVLHGTARESAIPGLRHNVSNTVSVREDEWDAVASYLWQHHDEFTGVSMLPDSGDTLYAFAPFEAIKTDAQERRWNDLVAEYKPVNYLALFEAEDGTALTAEAACAGGACEVVQ
jgi:hypothetical protein